MQRRLMAALALAVVATATAACSSAPPTPSAARRSTTTAAAAGPGAASTTTPSARPAGVPTTTSRGHRAGRSPAASSPGASGAPAGSPGAATPSPGGGSASGGGRPITTTTTRPAPVATTTATPGAPSTTTPAALLAQLATGGDLGDGWGPAPLAAQPSPPGACRGALAAAAAANPHAQAGFIQAPSSHLTELVIQFPSPDQASAGYHSVAAQFAGCGVAAQRVSVGLTSAAYSGTAGAPTPGGWLWLMGLKGSMIGVLTLSQPGAPPVPGELQPLAQAALAKLTG